ncbi:lysophospholipase, partial [Alphaproteobacteria bacterium]|nr:lysophospholipase [Alphaproteobacteria bacterium]
VKKRIIWFKEDNKKTPISIIYIHGFSASSEEIRPLPDLIAKKLKANIFYTRLKGHGRDANDMGQASIKSWLNDLHEAIEVGSRIGKRILVISTSTGGTLSSIAALDKGLSKNILGFVFISPNFGINNKYASMLTWPLSKYWLGLFIGDTRNSTSRNKLNSKFWTLNYPTTALIPMAKLVKIIKQKNFENVTIPALFYFSLNDKVVDPQKTINFISQWGGESKTINVKMTKYDDKYSHIVAGDIISPKQTKKAFSEISRWIKDINKK